MMEEIKKAHALVQDKTGLYTRLGKKFRIKPLSVRNNWFCNELAIVPESKQKLVLKELKAQLKKEQNE